MSKDDRPIDTLRMNPSQRDALLETLREKAGDAGESEDARKHTRVEFSSGEVTVTFMHPGGAETRCIITPRNLSVAGLGFLHGGFIHQDTECHVELPTLYGDTRRIRGRVRACRHVSGRIHEIGLRFDTEIDPYEFLEPADAPSAGVSHNVDPSELRGKALVIEGSGPDARLLAHHLKPSNIELEIRSEFAEAEGELASGEFDLVLLGDAALAESAQRVADARAKGYDGPILALTAESSAAWLTRLRQSGCVDTIVKPYNPGKLFATLSQHLPDCAETAAASGKIHSELATDPAAVELLETFLKDVDSSIKELNSLMSAGSIAEIRAICLGLKGTGQGYGYPRFSDAAREVVDSIDKKASAGQVEIALKRLELVFQRLTPAPIPTACDDDAPSDGESDDQANGEDETVE